MAMQGRRLSRKQVLAWNEPWSYTDLALITAALDAIPDAVFDLPASGGYIGVWTNGRRALVIWPGYLDWPGGRWTKDLSSDLFRHMHENEHDQWHELSTFQDRDVIRPVPDRPAKFCPYCHEAVPLTGICDCPGWASLC
jgi:hypothetical protein